MMKKFVAMAAVVAAAPADEDWKIDLDMLQGGVEADSQLYVFPYGQTKVTITAIENRSWGYEWDIKNDCQEHFKLIDDSYGYEHDNNSEQLLGRKGRRTMVFETPAYDSLQAAQGVHECSMTFTNKRPWL